MIGAAISAGVLIAVLVVWVARLSAWTASLEERIDLLVSSGLSRATKAEHENARLREAMRQAANLLTEAKP